LKKLNKKGFTLIELIVVIAILAILAMILIPSLTGYIAKATKAKDQANCRSAYTKYQLDLAVAASGAAVAAPTVPGATSVTPDPATPVGGDSLVDYTCVFPSGTFALSGGFQ